jgi:DNA-binding NarL/FixJ family response regulator
MIGENKKDMETLDLLQTKNTKEIFTIRCTLLGLTKREIEICELVREGYIYKEIANSLYIS